MESDLRFTLEGDFALPVNMTGPDGIFRNTTVDGRPLAGQVLFDIVRASDTGENITINTPVVSVRRSSLFRIPQPGENWVIAIPETPLLNAPLVQYALSVTRPPEGGSSTGFIRMYLQQVEQS